jgi:uncharacterized membrane protein YheB (UPF0754 family)
MENFEWQDEETELKYRLFQRMLNKSVKDKFEFIKQVDVDPVKFQRADVSWSFNKQYNVTILLDKSSISKYSEEQIDKFEYQFNELFDTLLKTIAPPKNKNDFRVIISSDIDLI